MSNTDMLTPEQFNEINDRENKKREKAGKKRRKINCLGYAIGVDEEGLELEYRGGKKIEDSFQEKLEKYGLIVRKVKSLDELKGKTGFILYGFYPMKIFFDLVYKDFHVVRVNPDGTYVHKQDMNLPARKVEILDERGAIEEYDGANEPIHIFLLEEERNKDKEKINKRIKAVFSQIKDVLDSKEVSDEDKSVIKQKLQLLNDRLNVQGKTMNSNDINILLQEFLTIAKEFNIEIETEGIELE